MKITQAKITETLKEVWPSLKYTWIFDGAFWIPTLYEITRLFENSAIRGKVDPFEPMESIPEFNDCDNFAGQFLHEVKRKRYFAYKNKSLPKTQAWPVTGFIAAGTKFNGNIMNHVACLYLCQEGFYFFDLTPGYDHYWRADPKMDDIYFISSL